MSLSHLMYLCFCDLSNLYRRVGLTYPGCITLPSSPCLSLFMSYLILFDPVWPYLIIAPQPLCHEICKHTFSSTPSTAQSCHSWIFRMFLSSTLPTKVGKIQKIIKYQRKQTALESRKIETCSTAFNPFAATLDMSEWVSNIPPNQYYRRDCSYVRGVVICSA